MIAKDEDGNWFAVISIGVAVPCRTKGEAERLSRTMTDGIYIGVGITCAVILLMAFFLYYVLR